jgi:hypothetical protein
MTIDAEVGTGKIDLDKVASVENVTAVTAVEECSSYYQTCL